MKNKDKSVAILLCLFLGALGAHKFYLNKPVQGFLYLIFCWTFIPVILAFIDLIRLIINTEDFKS